MRWVGSLITSFPNTTTGIAALTGSTARSRALGAATARLESPTLSEADGLAVVRALFGIELPGVHSLLDMEMGFPDEFFSQVVYGETQRALDAIGPDKTICWVSTGRAPHAGDAMTARDLYKILTPRVRPVSSAFSFIPTPNPAQPSGIFSPICAARRGKKIWTDLTGRPTRRAQPSAATANPSATDRTAALLQPGIRGMYT